MPRRIANTATDKQAGLPTNLRFRYRDGAGVLSGKNEMDNVLLDEFSATGELEGWVLDEPPEPVGIGIYRQIPGNPKMTKQGSVELGAAWDGKDPHIDGDSPPDVTRQSTIAPYAQPPRLELVASAGGVGYPAGWWAHAHAWGIGKIKKGLVTNCCLPFAAYCDNGQGFRLTINEEAPEGVTFMVLGMAGPFATEAAALNTTVMFEQERLPTNPRLPSIKDLMGRYRTNRRLSFTVNETYLGEKKKPKHKKKKKPGQNKKKKRGR